jgi:peptidoglycan/xylan/chitin deacetylase (PgdA/CDA1 family)
MHPHHIGHRSRLPLLDRLIQHMKARGDCWFCTHEQLARWCKAHAA